MTAAEYSFLLKDYANRDLLQKVNWNSFVTKYPYASSLYVFRAMAENPGSGIFEEILHEAASRTASRSRLMFLMEGTPELVFSWHESTTEKTGSPLEEPELNEAVEIGSGNEALVQELIIKSPVEFGFAFVKIKQQPKKAASPGAKEIPAGKSKAGKTRQQDLIDKFISEEPQLQPKLDFGNPGKQPDLARKSGKLQEEIISESMAMILIRQKKFEKAIVTLDKLSLKFPEKSDYFAALIKNLENQQTK